MSAANDSLHKIFGAAPDPRNFVKLKARLLGWMLLLLPIVGVSYAATTIVASNAGPVLDKIGLESTVGRIALSVLTLLLSYAMDFLVLYPPPQPFWRRSPRAPSAADRLSDWRRHHRAVEAGDGLGHRVVDRQAPVRRIGAAR